MMNRSNDNQTEREMADYLLGRMSEGEQARFEVRYLADDALFDRIQMVREELVDAYVRHHLDAETREKFERHFLATPEGQQEVAFARALREKLNAPAPLLPVNAGASSWWSWFGSWPIRQIGFAAASLLLIGAGWLLLENRKLRQELSALQIERADLARREEALRQQLARLTAPVIPSPAPLPNDRPAPAEQFLAINLLPAPRTGETNVQVVRLPAQPRRPRLNLKLNFEPVGLRCSVKLRTPDGETIERRNLSARPHPQDGYVIRADFATVALKAGQYEAIVIGRDADKNEPRQIPYRFRVENSLRQ